MAKGTASMEGDHNTHGAPLPEEEIVIVSENLDYPMKNFTFHKQ